MAVDRLGDHVEVAAQDHGLVELEQGCGVRAQALHPGELVGELVGADRVAVGQVDGGHPQVADGRLDVARLLVGGLARQAADHVLDRPPTKDRHAVVGLLAERRDVVAELADGLGRKGGIEALDLLEEGDIRPSLGQPGQHIGQPGIDRVDVPGGDRGHARRLASARPPANRDGARPGVPPSRGCR